MVALWAMYLNIPDKPLFDEMEGGIIEQYQQCLLPLRVFLPTMGIVGYASDVTGKNRKALFFQLAQYILAPVIIEDSTDYEVLIGNFTQQSSLEEFCRLHNVEITHTFPNGIYLMRNLR